MKKLEEITDIEVTIKLLYHLENPCGEGCRENYIRLSKWAIERFKNPFAIKLLEDKIRKYEN